MIRARDIQAGLQVRVIGNFLNGRQPDSELPLVIGQTITLTGSSAPGGTAYYHRGHFPRHNIRFEDIEPLNAVHFTPPATRSSVDIWQAARKYIRN
jgi:hypothetical protein